MKSKIAIVASLFVCVFVGASHGCDTNWPCVQSTVSFVSIDTRVDTGMGDLITYVNSTYLRAAGDHPAKALWMSLLVYAQKESRTVRIDYLTDAQGVKRIYNVVVF